MPGAMVARRRPACFLIKRHVSMTPRQLCVSFLLAAGLSLAIALVFSLIGAWPILPFAGLEAAALSLALVWHARRAEDFERITIDDGRVVIEVRESQRMRRIELDAPWVRVLFDAAHGRVYLAAPGRQVEIGGMLARCERPRLAEEMKSRLSLG